MYKQAILHGAKNSPKITEDVALKSDVSQLCVAGFVSRVYRIYSSNSPHSIPKKR